MSPQPMPSIDEELESHSISIPEDRLEKLREVIRDRRDLGEEITAAENNLAAMIKRKHLLDTEILPKLFGEIGVDRIGLPAEGNHAAIDAVLSNFYNASISARWDSERREAAFAKLADLGLGAIVRRKVESEFGPGEAGWQRVVDALDALGVAFAVHDSVHWKTLTAAIQSLCENGRAPGPADLETIGAYVGKIVNLKPRSE